MAESATEMSQCVHEEELDEDDLPILSSQALEALEEFLFEKNQVVIDDSMSGAASEGIMLMAEDWRLSQFWYDPATANTVAEEVSFLCRRTRSPVACISCPSLYAHLKKLDPDLKVRLMEYDKRFEKYGSEFTFYDYNCPIDLPVAMGHSYHVIVADPPYLSEECLEKVAQSIAFLSHPEETYILLLTGDVQREKAGELMGLRACEFRPQHSSKLGNEFRLFTNYDPGVRLGGWETKEKFV